MKSGLMTPPEVDELLFGLAFEVPLAEVPYDQYEKYWRRVLTLRRDRLSQLIREGMSAIQNFDSVMENAKAAGFELVRVRR